MMLQLGSRGDPVISMQNKLQVLDFYTHAVDGVFGLQTEQALMDFQEEENLTQDGIYGPYTHRNLVEALEEHREIGDLDQIDEEDYIEIAHRLTIDVGVLKAFADVESNGQAFFSEGRPAILFERHYMARMLEQRGLHLLKNIASQSLPDIVNATPGGYRGGEAEYERYNKAAQLHPQAAIESCSWGMFQIMGAHYLRLGFDSPEEFKAAMFQDASQHLEAVARFIETDNDLLQALREKDFATAARIYNGPNYDQHTPPYDERLEQAFEQYT